MGLTEGLVEASRAYYDGLLTKAEYLSKIITLLVDEYKGSGDDETPSLRLAKTILGE